MPPALVLCYVGEMAAATADLATAELLRGAEERPARTIARVLEAWKRDGVTGSRFSRALHDWLRKQNAISTRRTYAEAMESFFDWWTIVRKQPVPLPSSVRRTDATDYVAWQKTRKRALSIERLERDVPPIGRAARYVEQVGTVSVREASEALGLQYSVGYDQLGRRFESWHPAWQCLLQKRILGKQYNGTEYELFVVAYSTDEKQRYGHLFSEVAPLSSFWIACQQSGENDGSRPLLEHDIWQPFLKDFAGRARNYQEAMAPARMMTTDILQALLSTTVSNSKGAALIANIRDRLLILLLAEMGLRSDEAVRAKRKDVRDGKLHVVGKGDKLRVVPLTRNVAETILEFDRVYKSDGDEAPLLPAIKNPFCSPSGKYIQRNKSEMCTSNVRSILLRRAKLAGIGHSDPRRLAVHPHAMRKWFSRWQVSNGKPLPLVQAMLGHASLTTTGLYTKVATAADMEVAPIVLEPSAVAVAHAAPPALAVPRAREPVAAPPAPKQRPAAPETPVLSVVPRQTQPAPPSAVETPAPAPATAPPVSMASRGIIKRGAPSPEVIDVVPAPSTLDEEVVPKRAQASQRPTVVDMSELKRLWPTDRTRGELVSAYYGNGDRPWDERQTPWGGGSKKIALHTRKQEMRAVGADDYAKLEDRLVVVYVARESGLLWYWGTGNLLVPQAPVVSPDGWFEPSFEQAVRDLQSHWMETRPTAVRALMMWLTLMMSITQQADWEAARRGVEWAAFEDQSWPVPEELVRMPAEEERLKEPRKRALEAGQALKKSVAYQRYEARQEEVKKEIARLQPKGTRRRDLSEEAQARVAELELLREPTREEERAFALLKHAADEANDELARAQWSLVRAFRRHNVEQVVRWLSFRADDYGETLGDSDRQMQPLASRIPDGSAEWIYDEDPILSLPANEQVDLKDWIAILSGQLRSVSKTPLWQSVGGKPVSRSKLIEMLGLVVMELNEEENAERAGRTKKKLSPLAGAFDAAMAQFGVALTWAAFRKKTPSTDKSTVLRNLMQAVIGEVDEISMAMRLGKAVDEEWFRWPSSSPTIEHTETLRAQAARNGMHSECVARRLVRALWEAKKRSIGRKEAIGPTEINSITDQFLALFVPCPPALEQELLLRRRGEPLPDAIRAVQRSLLLDAQEAAMGPQEKEDVVSSERELKKAGMYIANGIKMLPNPVAFLRCLL